MAAKEMYDYLAAVAADSTETLTLPHGRTLTESGGFTGVTRTFDDSSEERVAYSTRPTFLISCPAVMQRTSDLGAVVDFYFATSKGHGMYRSFRFLHKDGHRYAVRFNNDLSRTYLTEPSSHQQLADITLKVLGRATAT